MDRKIKANNKFLKNNYKKIINKFLDQIQNVKNNNKLN